MRNWRGEREPERERESDTEREMVIESMDVFVFKIARYPGR